MALTGFALGRRSARNGGRAGLTFLMIVLAVVADVTTPRIQADGSDLFVSAPDGSVIIEGQAGTVDVDELVAEVSRLAEQVESLTSGQALDPLIEDRLNRAVPMAYRDSEDPQTLFDRFIRVGVLRQVDEIRTTNLAAVTALEARLNGRLADIEANEVLNHDALSTCGGHCQPGTFVSGFCDPGAGVRTTCSPCGNGSFSIGGLPSSCAPCSACPRGTRQTSNCSVATDTVCTECPAGTAGDGCSVRCNTTQTCPAGFRMTGCSATTGGVVCGQCPQGTYLEAQSRAAECIACARCTDGRMADYCGGAHRGSCVSRAIGWQNAGTGTADCSTWTTTRLLPRVLGQADCHLGACRLSGYPSGQNCIFNPVGAPSCQPRVESVGWIDGKGCESGAGRSALDIRMTLDFADYWGNGIIMFNTTIETRDGVWRFGGIGMQVVRVYLDGALLLTNAQRCGHVSSDVDCFRETDTGWRHVNRHLNAGRYNLTYMIESHSGGTPATGQGWICSSWRRPDTGEFASCMGVPGFG